MIEHLVRLLKDKYKLAILSRGYGRTTKGFRVANPTDNATTIGDEPLQFFKKFDPQICVSVGEERAMAVPNLLDHCPEIRVILLDDAYQHRRISPSFQILLTDYHKPFYQDFLLPVGSLRESRNGAERADVIVVTKCPAELSDDRMMEIETEIRKTSNKPLFFTSIRYGNLISFGSAVAKRLPDHVVLVTGIANAKPMVSFISNRYRLIKHFDFPDHHVYSPRDLQQIVDSTRAENAAVITTEKDFVKLDSGEFSIFLSQAPFFYLPIEIEFLKNGKDFDEMVLNVVKNA
jgi:tetraacyldisaccharide 4'-kinase